MKHAVLARKAGVTTAAQAKTPSQNAPGNLRIGEPNDAFEQEADRVADRAMSAAPGKRDWSLSKMNSGAPLQRQCACGGNAGPDGECEECRKKRALESAGGITGAHRPAEMGLTVCNPTTGIVEASVFTEHCAGNCVAQHEQQHKVDMSPCCQRYARCMKVNPGARFSLCRDAWNTWWDFNSDEEGTGFGAWTQYNAYKTEAQCLAPLVQQCKIGGGSVSESCCTELKRNFVSVTTEMARLQHAVRTTCPFSENGAIVRSIPEPTGASQTPQSTSRAAARLRSSLLQRTASHPSSPTPKTSEAPPIVHEVLRSPGQPLDAETRAFMEPRFGHDFSQVRVHADSRAAESARAVRALAYTVGHDIVFAQGRFAPQSRDGQRLLAHELAHTVQQRGTGEPTGETPDRSVARISTGDSGMFLRRSVSVSPAGSQFKFTSQPSPGLKVAPLFNKLRVQFFVDQPITFEASAKADCQPGDSTEGFEIGIVQVETHEVNNARYLGQTSSDGSVWVRRDIPAVRPAGPCLDSDFQAFWHHPVGLRCGQVVSTKFSDFPKDNYITTIQNDLTKKTNYLSELHAGFAFTTALMLKRPDQSLQTLHWGNWYAAWNFTFNTPPNGQSVPTGTAKCGSSQMDNLAPAPPELPTVYAIPPKNCLAIGAEAADNPASVQPSASW